nr:aldehyde dehydrogenase family protein [Novosphingobium pentaromativorans]
MAACDMHYIGGEWIAPVEAGRVVAVISPASETQIGTVIAGGSAEVDKAVAAARRALPAFSSTTPAERAELLGRILALMEDRAEDFAQIITAEMGCPIGFSRSAQVPFGLAHIRAAIEVLGRFEFSRRQGTTMIAREAIGVCALITPWNWPLYQMTAKVAPALSTGCTMVLKPSENSPFSAQLFAQVLDEADLPAGVFNMVTGTGPEVGALLSSHVDVDMVSITGSTRAGVQVAQAAAPTVKRVTQELSGKSPNILLDDADFARVVPLGVASAMRNAGQSCSAPTRMLVPKRRLPEAEALAAAAADTIIVGDPRNDETVMGPLANRSQFEMVQAMIESGIAQGARLLCGGPGRPEGLERGFYTKPTIFSDVSSDMRIAREEIFGPVLCLIPYEDEQDAIRIANDTCYGLGSHVQSADLDRARRVAMQVRAGQVHINYPAWDAHAAFGGYKQSGNGREYGSFGFEEYLETKSVLGYFPS